MMRKSVLFVAAAVAVAPAAASAADVSLVCTETVPDAEGDTAQVREAKTFVLNFNAKGSKLRKISAVDPDLVLDPMATMPVYSGGTSRNGGVVITKSEPPTPKPLKLKGKTNGTGGYSFTEKSTSLVLNLTPAEMPGTYSYEFRGSRLLGGSFRAMYDGQGSCQTQTQGEA